MKKISRQSDKNLTKQVRIDAGLHQLLKIQASRDGVAIKTFLDRYLTELLKVAIKKHSYQISCEDN